jgi:hypothetical protein
MGLRDLANALLGVSTYTRPHAQQGLEIDSPFVRRVRDTFGGNLTAPPVTRLEWYLEDLDMAQRAADAGDLSYVAQLSRAMRRDGTVSGLMSTLTGGVVGLPKKFYGSYGVAELKARNGTRSVFDDMIPSAEFCNFLDDGEKCGVAVGELLDVEGRDFPVFVRLEPEFLYFRWNENRWYYRSLAGLLPIFPGDGRWVLHTPGGRIAPWMAGMWPALGRSYINKEHALLHRSNYGAKLANPARVAVSPSGASEEQHQDWFQQVMAWGVNTVFGMRPGYDVKLLESNGRGHDVFQADIDTSDKEISIRISGQDVTTSGGVGFQNSDVFRAIKTDIVKRCAADAAHTINTQILPQFIAQRHGEAALKQGACIEYDVSRPKDLAVEAASLTATATAISTLREALAAYGKDLDIEELVVRFGIPIRGDVNNDGVPESSIDADPRERAHAAVEAAAAHYAAHGGLQ